MTLVIKIIIIHCLISGAALISCLVSVHWDIRKWRKELEEKIKNLEEKNQ